MSEEAKETQSGKPKTISDIMKEAEAEINKADGVKDVQASINDTYLDKLSFTDDVLTATLGLGAKQSFDQLLERLELYLNRPACHVGRVQRGLGYENLLFMAAELLLLESHREQLPLLLIEEPEAHLHPQHQSLFMEVLEAKATKPKEGETRRQVQVLLTTHSPQLAASADLNSMTMVYGHYPLGKDHTKLDADDYAFLRRLLDATKANLFFARGVIVVEGDAENVLLPAIARKMGRPLGKHGVSIVKVGHRGLFRYSRILQRKAGRGPIPVALIPDRDIPPDEAKALVGSRLTESEWDATKKAEHEKDLVAEKGENVMAFHSDAWTLEFDLARNEELALMMHQAIALARRPAKKREDVLKEAKTEFEGWKRDGCTSQAEIAVKVYAPLSNGHPSKVLAAEQLARLIEEAPEDKAFRSKLPQYLVRAIDHVTSGLPS